MFVYTGSTGVFDGSKNMSGNAVVAATKKNPVTVSGV